MIHINLPRVYCVYSAECVRSLSVQYCLTHTHTRTNTKKNEQYHFYVNCMQSDSPQEMPRCTYTDTQPARAIFMYKSARLPIGRARYPLHSRGSDRGATQTLAHGGGVHGFRHSAATAATCATGLSMLSFIDYRAGVRRCVAMRFNDPAASCSRGRRTVSR